MQWMLDMIGHVFFFFGGVAGWPSHLNSKLSWWLSCHKATHMTQMAAETTLTQIASVVVQKKHWILSCVALTTFKDMATIDSQVKLTKPITSQADVRNYGLCASPPEFAQPAPMMSTMRTFQCDQSKKVDVPIPVSSGGGKPRVTQRSQR